jgi:hypothetical protein
VANAPLACLVHSNPGMDTHARPDLPVSKPKIAFGERDGVGRALVEVAEASTQLVGDRIDLAFLQVRGELARFSLVCLAALTLVGGWIASCFALGALIAEHTSASLALGVMGVFHLAVGGVLLAMARRRSRSGREALR